MSIRHAALRAAFRSADTVAGWRSPRIRGTARYLIALLDQGRFGEVDALLAQGARKLAGRGIAKAQGTRAPRRNAIPIDAARQRLDAAGNVVAKRCWIYPGADAAVLVSVVIPCYNYGRFLMDAIDSARAQTIGSKEIIVVDDGSTDPATIALIERLRAEPDLRIISQANAGLPAARNAGIAVASGEFVCCLDADDMLDPTYLECTIAKLLADSSLGFAYSHVQFVGDINEVWVTHDFDIDEALIANFTAVSAVFRRDDWAELGGYAPQMRGGFEDWEFWIRLACLGRRGKVLPQPLFLHRRHGRTMTSEAKEQYDELHGRIRARNPQVFNDSVLRRRLKRLGPVERSGSTALARLSASTAADARPGLLVVIAWARRGGAEVLLLSILRALADSWRIVLVTMEDDPHAMADEFRPVTQELFHLSGMFDDSERDAFLAHLCRSRGVTHGLSSASASLLLGLPTLKAAFPALRWIHITHNEVPDSVFRAALAAKQMIYRYVAVSRAVEQALSTAGVDPAHIARIDNGIDPEPFAEAAQHRHAVRQDLGIAPHERLLLWVGRFAPEKRPELFVETLRSMGALSVRGIMVGEGPLEPKVDAAIAAAMMTSRLTRLGHRGRDDVARLLAAADALVLTSLYEGLPLVVLEALAAGCPVVATDVGDVSEVVRPGETGALVDPARPEGLGAAAKQVLAELGNPEARAGIRARFATGRHTAAAMNRAYAALLDEQA